MATIHPGQAPRKLTAALRARVLDRTRQARCDGSTHWSLRKMAAVMKVNKNLIARIWHEAELKPHRLERYFMTVGRAARGEAARIESLDNEDEDSAEINETRAYDVEHLFRLRSDYLVRVRLPEDFTEKEAQRLGDFLKTLPV